MIAGSKKALIDELLRLYEDASYSAQSYYESAKSALFWGKSVVFIPALLASLSALLVTMGAPKELSALSAIASAVSATSAFLGSMRVAEEHTDAAKEFTRIRHAARLEVALAENNADAELDATLRSLRNDYYGVVKSVSPVKNRFFNRADKRIEAGVLNYDSKEDA